MASSNRQLYLDIQQLVAGINSLDDLYASSEIQSQLIDFASHQDIPLGKTVEGIFFQLKHYLSLVDQSKGDLDLYTLLTGGDSKTETTLGAAVMAKQETVIPLTSDTPVSTTTEKLNLHQKIALAQKNWSRLQIIQQNLNQKSNTASIINQQINNYNPKGVPLQRTSTTISALVDQLPQTQSISPQVHQKIVANAANLLVASPNLDLAAAVAIATSTELDLATQEAENLSQYIETGADYDVATETVNQELSNFDSYADTNEAITSAATEVFPEEITASQTDTFLNLVAQEQLNIDPTGEIAINRFPSPSASETAATIKTLSQNLNDPLALATETYSRINPESLSLAIEYGLKYPDTPLGQFVKNNYQFLSRLTDAYQEVQSSKLGADIRSEVPKIYQPGPQFQPTLNLKQGLGKAQSALSQATQLTNRLSSRLPQQWQTYIARATSKTPALGNALGIISNPIGAAKSWAGQQAGKHLGDLAAKKLGAESLNALSSQVKNRLLTEGAKQLTKIVGEEAAKQIASFAAKGGIKAGIEALLVGAGVPTGGATVLAWVAFEIIWWVGDKTIGFAWNKFKDLYRAIFGEDPNIGDLAVVGAATSGALALGSSLGSALLVGTAVGVGVGVGAAVVAGTLTTMLIAGITTLVIYLSSFVVGPLISTFVHLESMPRTSYSGPIMPGCPEIQPFSGSFEITQGPNATGCTHAGGVQAVDYGTPIGTPIVSITDGIVSFAGAHQSRYGNLIIIESETLDGTKFQILYAHLSEVAVSLGDTVKAGMSIGSTGNSGGWAPHLHLEYKGIPYNSCPAGGQVIPEGCCQDFPPGCGYTQ